MNIPATISQAERALATATTTRQTTHIEAVASAGMAYAKEMENYEAYLMAWRVYELARIRTTELALDNMDVMGEIGWTPMQLSRRRSELAVKDKMNDYYDYCVSNGWSPSIHGFVKFSGEEIEKEKSIINPMTVSLKNLSKSLREDIMLWRTQGKELCERIEKESA